MPTRKQSPALKRAKSVKAKSNGATQSQKGAATVIYVHGIGNKPPASALKAQWDHALFEFDLGERSRMAYWVDRERYPEPLALLASDSDFSDMSDEAVPAEFSAQATRAEWNQTAELQRAVAEINEI